MFICVPLALYVFVALEFGIAFGIFVSCFAECRDEIGENQGVDAFVLIFRLHGDKKQVDGIGVAFQGAQQVIPAGGEEFAPAFAQGVRQRRHGYADSNDVVVFVDYDRHAVESDDGEILIDVCVDLFVGQWRKPIQVGIGLVDEVEERPSVALLDDFA